MGEREEFDMERLRIVKMEKIEPIPDIDQRGTSDPLERFKAVVRDLTESALEIVNRISANEMSKPEPQAELVEEYYLLHHYLDFLKRFASSSNNFRMRNSEL
jgi:hypothetical protein